MKVHMHILSAMAIADLQPHRHVSCCHVSDLYTALLQGRHLDLILVGTAGANAASQLFRKGSHAIKCYEEPQQHQISNNHEVCCRRSLPCGSSTKLFAINSGCLANLDPTFSRKALQALTGQMLRRLKTHLLSVLTIRL